MYHFKSSKRSVSKGMTTQANGGASGSASRIGRNEVNGNGQVVLVQMVMINAGKIIWIQV